MVNPFMVSEFGRWFSRSAFTAFVLGVGMTVAGLSYQNLGSQPASLETTVHDHGPFGHDGSEGQVLRTSPEESVSLGAACPAGTSVRAYKVAAIQLEITLNRYLDYDPEGLMYVLEEDLPRVRREEAQNRATRAGKGEPAVSIGLQGDAIQPLVLRVNQGECLRVSLHNTLERTAVSLHIHGSSLHVLGSGKPAIATNPESLVRPGSSVTYEWLVSRAEPEGTHYLHSHGDTRWQTGHGLFGAVIVEPRGSRWLAPGGGALSSGWAASLQPPSGHAFREFALIYHEIGDEQYRHLDRAGQLVTQVDPYTSAYRPGDRAINYRSEPFMNRLALQQTKQQHFDESLAYSSYAFGDPATPIMRSYLGDPVKQRVVHGGAEVFHVHHVHGGSIRWRRQPGLEPTGFALGLQKHPPLTPSASERLDSQALGPSESFDLENECGAGGCQQGAGDFLVHCHVAHHYFAGMWGLWRVYNTRQEQKNSQDGLGTLAELPDRLAWLQPAVTSSELIGKTVDWLGKPLEVTKDNLEHLVETQLPPSGVPRGYDASVLDWRKEGEQYLGEPETSQVWPGYRSAAPNSRLPIRFDPLTGKLAYPWLRPHFAKRPPFAPNHGPAPFLEPEHTGSDPAPPGENGPSSLCPTGTRLKSLAIHAINLPITINPKNKLVDPVGEIFVLEDQEAAVRANQAARTPLAIRANAGEDCLDIVFKSELEDTRENFFFSKASLHIHFVQFDVQGSDGVDAGFNYEQTLRPFAVEGEKLKASTTAGERRVTFEKTGRFQPGALVGVGMDEMRTFEVRRIEAIEGSNLVFNQALEFDHASGEVVSSEFVRYRWYPDVQFGTAYFHDHVAGLTSWQHGLFGALISEPPGSSYHDPHSGQPLESGALADVHTNARVSADVSGSFRELVLLMQDGNPYTAQGNSSGSSINLRAEPLERRLKTSGSDPSRVFSSRLHGDPVTPLLEAYLGDPLVVRTLVAGTNDIHSLHIDGHWFRLEPWDVSSPAISTAYVGISERFDAVIPRAGGPQRQPGDYLYQNGRPFRLREGSWGLIRVYDGKTPTDLQALPGRPVLESAANTCPANAPRKRFSLVVLEVGLPMLGGAKGKIYALEADASALLSGSRNPEPLVLHVNLGDCLEIALKNDTRAGPVSFHADLLAANPNDSMGLETGRNPPQAVAPGQRGTIMLYAHPELGEITALVRDGGDPLHNPRLGLYGAIIVGAAGSRYTDPITGRDLSLASGVQVDVHPLTGSSYRDFSLFMQDEDEVIGTALMPYTQQVSGVVGLNYRREPLGPRLKRNPDPARLYQSTTHGDPSTPVLEAFAGDPLRLHILAPYSEQAHSFSLEGHRWSLQAGRAGSNLVSSAQLGALGVLNLEPQGGAGGNARMPGDYLYGDHREPYREAGLWGLLRVLAPGDPRARIKALPRR